MSEMQSSKLKSGVKKSVGILGAGQWGTVLSLLAARGKNKVFLYDHNTKRSLQTQKLRVNKEYLPKVKLPSNIHIINQIDLVFKECDLVFIAVPSKGFRSLCENFSKFITNKHMLVHGTKGLESKTLLRMSEILEDLGSTNHIGAISGPNLALEIVKGFPSATVIASHSNKTILACQEALASSSFRVYGNPDIIGVEWCGIFKNILAIASGIVSGLGMGQNTTSLLITRGLAEMSRFLIQVGGKQQTLLGLAGIGDIIATCTSPLSRNHQAGQLIAKSHGGNYKPQILNTTVEGLYSVHTMYGFSKNHGIDMPIIEALKKILDSKSNIRNAVKSLMERPSKFE